jgi:phosphohistidine phosphatase
MALYLVQHGRSLPKELDPDQGLSEHGKTEVELLARKAKKCGLHISEIIHSGKTRARQTAEIYAAHLTPGRQPSISAGLKALNDVEPYAQTLADRDELMIVGHLPFMERLASYLITGSSEPPVVRFVNGGIVCLDQNPQRGAWLVRWVLIPEIV